MLLVLFLVLALPTGFATNNSTCSCNATFFSMSGCPGIGTSYYISGSTSCQNSTSLSSFGASSFQIVSCIQALTWTFYNQTSCSTVNTTATTEAYPLGTCSATSLFGSSSSSVRVTCSSGTSLVASWVLMATCLIAAWSLGTR